jgi:membrane fusion protein (multidrug efflux system)
MPDGSHTTEILVPDAQTSNTAPQTDGDARKKKLRKKLLMLLAGKVVSSIVGTWAYWHFYASHYVSTDNAYVGASTAQITSQVSGAVANVLVDDAQSVRQGDILVVLSEADAEIAVAKADAELAKTEQRIRQYFAQEAAALAQVRMREVELNRAAVQLSRRQDLAVTGAISAEELTIAKAGYDQAQAALVASTETLAAARALTASTSVEMHPEALVAQAALEAAKLDQSRTVIRAPVDGIVAQRKVQIGQRIQPGQGLMVVTPVKDAYVDANFKESQLKDVTVGQKVELVSDLYGDDVVYSGTVAGVGGGTGSAFAVIPAQNATGNWIKVVQRLPVRIDLDRAQTEAHPLRVGLSMTATINTRTAVQ